MWQHEEEIVFVRVCRHVFISENPEMLPTYFFLDTDYYKRSHAN